MWSPIWPPIPGRIFCESDSTPWSSYFYQHNFLYPFLEHLQKAGDMYLRPFIGNGNSIRNRFWSLHMTPIIGVLALMPAGVAPMMASHSMPPGQARSTSMHVDVAIMVLSPSTSSTRSRLMLTASLSPYTVNNGFFLNSFSNFPPALWLGLGGYWLPGYCVLWLNLLVAGGREPLE